MEIVDLNERALIGDREDLTDVLALLDENSQQLLSPSLNSTLPRLLTGVLAHLLKRIDQGRLGYMTSVNAYPQELETAARTGSSYAIILSPLDTCDTPVGLVRIR